MRATVTQINQTNEAQNLTPIGKILFWTVKDIIPVDKFNNFLNYLDENDYPYRLYNTVVNYHRLVSAASSLTEILNKKYAEEHSGETIEYFYDVTVRPEKKLGEKNWRIIVQAPNSPDLYSTSLVVRITEDLFSPIKFVTGDQELFSLLQDQMGNYVHGLAVGQVLISLIKYYFGITLRGCGGLYFVPSPYDAKFEELQDKLLELCNCDLTMYTVVDAKKDVENIYESVLEHLKEIKKGIESRIINRVRKIREKTRDQIIQTIQESLDAIRIYKNLLKQSMSDIEKEFYNIMQEVQRAE
jgi:stress-induced morphogen